LNEHLSVVEYTRIQIARQCILTMYHSVYMNVQVSRPLRLCEMMTNTTV